ncbi:unnamed protein product [Cyprideis torosa]|uniref:Uncharacterized protein n=1 Tax=Cyprideis torosa TaxID=163714 RepID=A0A7R8ZNX6_9CRUS|nr:unnamed protein product [Cyprideis torosa]CAG0892564.1 unnamed protein product [Cyprideis torosa]
MSCADEESFCRLAIVTTACLNIVLSFAAIVIYSVNISDYRGGNHFTEDVEQEKTRLNLVVFGLIFAIIHMIVSAVLLVATLYTKAWEDFRWIQFVFWFSSMAFMVLAMALFIWEFWWAVNKHEEHDEEGGSWAKMRHYGAYWLPALFWVPILFVSALIVEGGMWGCYINLCYFGRTQWNNIVMAMAIINICICLGAIAMYAINLADYEDKDILSKAPLTKDGDASSEEEGSEEESEEGSEDKSGEENGEERAIKFYSRGERQKQPEIKWAIVAALSAAALHLLASILLAIAASCGYSRTNPPWRLFFIFTGVVFILTALCSTAVVLYYIYNDPGNCSEEHEDCSREFRHYWLPSIVWSVLVFLTGHLVLFSLCLGGPRRDRFGRILLVM